MANRLDRLAAMETYIRVVETGSFSAAARFLRVGQPAISKTVAQLESRLAVKLLTRSTRGLAVTEAGQRFYERAKRTIEEADEADAAARGVGRGLIGRLRVSAAVTFARLHLVPRLAPFLAAHPGLDLDIVLDDRVVDLVQEGIDVAFRMGALSESSLTARRIGRGQRLVLGTPTYFKAAGTPHKPADLVGHQLVVYTREGENRAWPFRQNGAQTSVAMNGRLKVSAAEGVRAAVLAHLGITIASAWMFSPEIASGEVIPVLTDWELPAIELFAVFPSGSAMTPKARAFVAFIERSLRDGAASG